MRRDWPSPRRWPATVAVLCLLPAAGGVARAESTYHVRPGGDDRGDGRTPSTAWRTIARVNAQPLGPGDRVLLERGGEWRESLVASSSGTAARPIVFGAYGQGAGPKLWGSDVVDNAGFRPGPGGVFEVAVPREIHAVLVDHRFLRGARLVLQGDDPAAAFDHVRSHPGTWAVARGLLRINIGGVDPRSDARAITAVVRDDVVSTNGQSHLVLRDLVVDESARFDAGYGFRVQGGSGVRLEGCEAYRCGKHHFGVINSTGFVGEGLLAAFAMPDQGVGGASAFVSYSDRTRRGDTSEYLRCTAEHLDDAGTGGRYPAFVAHGEGIGSILLDGLTSRGGDVSLGNGESGATIRVRGGRLEDATLGVHGDRIVVDGMTVVGERAGVALEGADNVLQNLVIVGGNPGFAGHQAAITEGGRRNTIRSCTIALDPRAPDFDAAISLKRPGTGLRWHGNILRTNGTAVRAWFAGFDPKGYDASDNLYGPGARFDTRYDGRGALLSLDAWKATGLDAGSLAADPKFVDAPGGDYAPAPGSPAIDAARPVAARPGQVPLDARGTPRPQGPACDLGAIEAPRGR